MYVFVRYISIFVLTKGIFILQYIEMRKQYAIMLKHEVAIDEREIMNQILQKHAKELRIDMEKFIWVTKYFEEQKSFG